MKILAVVVTYYPEKVLLKKNIDNICNIVDKIIIWENTPLSERANYRCILNEKVEYCGDDINSISLGLNYGWKYARDNGFDYLLTMDQDSIFIDFERYVITTIDNNEKDLGITGPAVVDSESKFIEPVITERSLENHLITSGMLVPLVVLDSINGYNNNFSVEAIDADFCYRVLKSGFKMYRNGNGRLIQIFGNPSEHKLFGRIYICPNYNKKRIYEIVRNHIILYRQYKEKALRIIVIGYIRNFVPCIILWGSNKKDKLMALFKGVIDGVLYRIK